MSQPDNPPEKLIKLNRPDYDGAWKVSLDQYFKDFLALLFPAIHAEVDWSKGYVFLDSELAKITVDAKTGRRYADKLVKVHTLAGVEEWLLIHVEVQSSPEPQGVFARRMFTYWSRLMDYHQVDVVSLAVLADTNENYRPTTFKFSRSGTENTFTYPIAKLTDFETEEDWASLQTSDNVFALVVMAQIKAKRLKGNEGELFAFKVGLTRSLYERGYSVEKIRELFKLIDWMLWLPSEFDEQLRRAVDEAQGDKIMPYITTFERLSYNEGFEEAEKRFEQERLKAAQEQLEKTKNIARGMFSVEGLDDKRIADITGLSVAEITELRLSSQH